MRRLPARIPTTPGVRGQWPRRHLPEPAEVRRARRAGQRPPVGGCQVKPESHYALIPRRVVLNRMETADCLEARVHWAIILWSWCGPGRTEDGAVVVKDRRGFIQRDGAGNQIPARAIDLLQLLGLAAGMKGNLSRAIARLKMKGVIRFEGKVMYSVDSPPIIEDSGSCQYQQL